MPCAPKSATVASPEAAGLNSKVEGFAICYAHGSISLTINIREDAVYISAASIPLFNLRSLSYQELS